MTLGINKAITKKKKKIRNKAITSFLRLVKSTHNALALTCRVAQHEVYSKPDDLDLEKPL